MNTIARQNLVRSCKPTRPAVSIILFTVYLEDQSVAQGLRSIAKASILEVGLCHPVKCCVPNQMRPFWEQPFLILRRTPFHRYGVNAESGPILCSKMHQSRFFARLILSCRVIWTGPFTQTALSKHLLQQQPH